MSNRFVVSDRSVAVRAITRKPANNIDFALAIIVAFAVAFIAGRMFF